MNGLKNERRLGALMTVAIAASLLLSAAPADAATENPAGGTWNYGNAMGWNYSDYKVNRDHSSTVVCGDRTDRKLAGPNQWSNAGLWAVSGCGFYWGLL